MEIQSSNNNIRCTKVMVQQKIEDLEWKANVQLFLAKNRNMFQNKQTVLNIMHANLGMIENCVNFLFKIL